ncbi:MAG: YDG domain-containing protein, partial [Limisphaerales bacterium]
NSSTVTYGGFGGGIDNGSLDKEGNGSLALRGTNNLPNGVTINGGTLSVGAGPDRIASAGGAVLTIGNGATFQLDAATQTVAQISGSGVINLGGGTLYVNTPLGNSYAGVIRDTDLGTNSTAQGHGLRGYYYDNQDFSTLLTVRDDANLNFTDLTSATQLPAPIYPNTNQTSIRWLGQVLSTAAGTYTFAVTADDGVRLWVGGIPVIDGWTTGSSTRTGTITLAAGTRYDIIVEYFNQTGLASCKLAWTPPGDTVSTIIPTDFLFLPTPGSVVKDGAGSLQLTGTNNTYTGSTIVKAGTLQISADHGLGLGNVYVQDGATLTLDTGTVNDYIANSADLILTASASVNLNYTGTDTVRSLSLDGGATYKTAGTYGAAGSGAQHTDSHFSGSGRILVAGLPSTTTLGSSTGTTVYGATVTFTAVAHGTGVTPTGTITFFDGANAMGAVAVDGTGTAVLAVSDLLVPSSPHSVTAVYNGDATYSPSTSSAVTQTVTPITLTGVTGSTKVYDQTTTAPLNLTNLVGELPSDTNLVQIAAGYVANFPDKNVGNGKSITASGITLTGGAAGNYTIASTASTFGNITPKLLTVTNATASNKIYDGTVTATVSTSAAGITGVSTNVIFVGDDVSTNVTTSAATGVFSDPNVGTAKTVTATVPLSGTDAGNYLATAVPKANITIATSALALTSSANPANAGDNVSFTATASPLTGAGTPTGNVVFLTNGVVFSTVPLSGGSANSGGTTTLTGTNTITAQYATSANFVGSTNTLQQVINQSLAQPTMAIGQSGNSITITWAGTFNLQSVGALQSSGTGWLTIPGATSGYTTPITNASTFYRLSN